MHFWFNEWSYSYTAYTTGWITVQHSDNYVKTTQVPPIVSL